MLIVNSATYVPAELIAEIGQIPPSFLPLRNRPLFHWQFSVLEEYEGKKILALPSDFEVDEWDLEFLRKAGVIIATTNPAVDLRQSLLTLLHEFPIQKGEGLSLLHGDTLLESVLLSSKDAVAVAPNDGFYKRAFVTSKGGVFDRAEYKYCHPGDAVLTGYFAFSDAAAFAGNLGRTSDFISAVNSYGKDRPLLILDAPDWSDCGHVNAYYRTRSRHTGERAFNQLRTKHFYMRKRSVNEVKIVAEMNWFNSLPPSMSHYLPQIGESSAEEGNTFYDIEYLFCFPLSDLLVYGRVSLEDWGLILRRCLDFLVDCESGTPPEARVGLRGSMYLVKTQARLEEFSSLSGWDISRATVINGEEYPSLSQLALAAQRVIDSAATPLSSIVHGDLCFSNILYDMRAQRIKVIDPRGIDANGELSCYGDIRYDIGKLFHSVVGGYDFVVAGRIKATSIGANEIGIQGDVPARIHELGDLFISIFGKAMQDHGGERVIAAVTVHLFLSMLPLHSDDSSRQLSLMSRAVSLCSRYQLGVPA